MLIANRIIFLKSPLCEKILRKWYTIYWMNYCIIPMQFNDCKFLHQKERFLKGSLLSSVNFSIITSAFNSHWLNKVVYNFLWYKMSTIVDLPFYLYYVYFKNWSNIMIVIDLGQVGHWVAFKVTNFTEMKGTKHYFNSTAVNVHLILELKS